MFNWLRELIELRRDARHCETCDVLRHELEVVRLDNVRLLDRILSVPKEEPRIDTSDIKPIPPRNISWNVRRQMLENEARDQARLLRESQVSKEPVKGQQEKITELEKELGVN